MTEVGGQQPEDWALRLNIEHGTDECRGNR